MTFLKKINFAIPFALVLLLLTLLWAELSSTRSYAYSSGIVGERIPNFSLPSLSGAGNLTQKNLSGRVTLLNFFASWCSACQAEHPMLMKIKKKYGIPIYGIAFRDDPREARAMLNRYGNPYVQAAYDNDGETAVDFGIYATPETFVIGPNGEILYKQVGVIDQDTWDSEIYPIIKKYQK
jgi:cytochrome c biogenesis protein CcmG, thiol:disulfide interchange protein DsbE